MYRNPLNEFKWVLKCSDNTIINSYCPLTIIFNFFKMFSIIL